MADFAGRLAKAPVVYVLAQIKFSPVLQMDKYVPAIQEELRADYPRYEHQQIGAIEVSMEDASPTPSVTNRWVFRDKENVCGFILDQSSLVFHTTSYKDFDDFRTKLLYGLEITHKVVEIPLIERIGLRYIDLIVPAKGENVDEYVCPSLAGFSLREIGLASNVKQQFLTGNTKAGQLVVRYTKANHATPLPPDLSPPALRFERMPDPETRSAILDTDHFMERSVDFDLQEMRKLVDNLQAPIGDVFKAAITEKAVKAWS